MSRYIIRLDDACSKRNIEKWNKIEVLLDKYCIKPLVGIIPNCEDPDMDGYSEDLHFWDKAAEWQAKGWVIAMHGYNHVFCTKKGGINPVNQVSEFADVPLEKQKEKIIQGLKIFDEHNIKPVVFFAPAHTFDNNTLIALKECSDIRIISDTVANAPYKEGEFTFVPQQSGKARNLPFHTVTFCYHPNGMSDKDIENLDCFISRHRKEFVIFPTNSSNRRKTFYDKFLSFLYFLRK